MLCANPPFCNLLYDVQSINNVDQELCETLKGTQQWYANREIVPSQSALKFRKQYVDKHDTLQRFINECVQKSKNYRVRKSEFINLYNSWCDDNGVKPFSKSVTLEMLPKKKLKMVKNNGYDVIKDIIISYECEY